MDKQPMDRPRLESMLIDYGRKLCAIPPENPPTSECLPIPLLEEMTTNPDAGTAAERAHVESCGFCAGMLERVRVEAESQGVEDADSEPVHRAIAWPLRWRICIPAALAACLVLGVGLGRILPVPEPASPILGADAREPSIVKGWGERSADTLPPTGPGTERLRVRAAARAFLKRSAGPFATENADAEERERRYEELQQWKAEAEEHLRQVLDLLDDDPAESDR